MFTVLKGREAGEKRDWGGEGNKIVREVRTKSTQPPLPWWTWVAPALVCHAGTQLSLHFQYAPGVALLYLPIPLAMAMVQWWGPRVLLGVYLNALVCAGWWGLPQMQWWPLYALPETLAVGASWFFFQRIAGGRCWIPELRDLVHFLLLAVFPAAAINGFQVPAQLVMTGDLPASDYGQIAWGEWVATAFSGLGVALPLLYFGTPYLEGRGWTRTRGAPSRRLAGEMRPDFLNLAEISAILVLTVVLSAFMSVTHYWYVFVVIGLWAGLRFGLGMALLVNMWIVTLTLGLPWVFPFSSALTSVGDADLTNLHVGLATICVMSSVTGCMTGSLRRELAQRRAAETELKESEFLFRSQFDLGNIGMALVGPDHKWIRVNRKLLTMFGYTEDEMRTKTWDELTHPDDMRDSEHNFDRLIASEIDGYEMDKRYFRKDGSVLYAHVTVACFRGPDGRPRCNIASLQDLSERRRLEAQLRQAQKMEAVGQLAGGVAHDFNNLLQAILGCGEMALEQVRPGDPVHRDITDIVETAQRATRLVSQLLAFSRRQVLELKHLSLDEVIEDLHGMLRRVIRQDIALEIDCRAGGFIIRADRGQIEQVVVNLCVNARDAITGPGRITIRTEPLRRKAARTDGESQFVSLSVSDSGAGMDSDTLQHLFEPFFTTKGPGKGSGLGLATVYGVVCQHNATVEVESEPGKGTSFRICFPIAESAADIISPDRPRSKDSVPVVGGTETILLAEDEPSVRSLAVRFLEGAGYRVVPVEDGEAAMNVLRAGQVPIDLAVLDVIMPKAGGRAVYDFIQAERPGIPVLFVSGYNAGDIHSGFVLDDGLTLVQKPYRRSDLLQKIRELLAVSREIQLSAEAPSVPQAAQQARQNP